MHEVLTAATTSGQSKSGSNGSEGLIYPLPD